MRPTPVATPTASRLPAHPGQAGVLRRVWPGEPDARMGPAGYCRRARRLRGRLAGDPFLLHHSLATLAKERDAETGPLIAPPPATGRAGRALRAKGEPTSMRIVPSNDDDVALDVPRRATRRPAIVYDAPPPSSALIAGIPASVANEFAMLVKQQLEGPILPYSKREALLAEAEQIGIARFEANLIIAAVQHRQPADENDATTVNRSRAKRGRWIVVSTFLAIEMAVSVAIWWVLRG